MSSPAVFAQTCDDLHVSLCVELKAIDNVNFRNNVPTCVYSLCITEQCDVVDDYNCEREHCVISADFCEETNCLAQFSLILQILPGGRLG